MDSQPVQAADVTIAISKLKNTKSTGHDQIKLQHIKGSLLVAVAYITLIINTVPQLQQWYLMNPGSPR